METSSEQPRNRFKTRILAGIGGFLAAALSLAMSVYHARNPDNVPAIAPGDPIEAGRWRVTLHSSAVATGKTPDGLRLMPGKKAVVVDLTLENLTGETSNVYYKTLRLKNLSGVEDPQFYLSRDGDVLGGLQPLMPEAITAVWQLPADQPLPKDLEISVIADTFKARDNLYGASGWFNPHDVAEVALPISLPPEAMR